MRHTSLLLGSLLCTLALTVHAQSHHDGHHHGDAHHQSGTASLDAHEHGVATLNLVVDGQQLVLQLESPAANIVGFEYMPSSEQDLATVKQARQRLEQAESLFVFSAGADCVLEKVETQSPLLAAKASEEHGHHHDGTHNEHHDGHKEHHGHHGHDQHADHADHADGESAHSDIDASFHFACANPEALQEIDVKLFETFPSTEKLLLQAITPQGQQGGELTPTQSVIRL